MKRICLFAGYNYNNVISQYVLDYLNELNRYCDIYYMADGTISEDQLSRLKPFVKGAWNEEHHGYDFYSWKILIEDKVGWDILQTYDELLLVNDSCFCVNSFKPVFEKMDKLDLGMWGLQSCDVNNIDMVSTFSQYLRKNIHTFHIGSYFLAFRNKFFTAKCFKEFINSIEIESSRENVCIKYEFNILNIAKENCFSIDVWSDMVWRYSTMYMHDAFNLIKNGYPLLKVRIFLDNIGGDSYMEEIAKAIVPFCEKNYLEYIDDVRIERKWKHKKKNKLSKIKQMRRYIVPPVLCKCFNMHIYSKFVKYILKFIKNECIPPFIHDIWYNIFHFKSIHNVNNVKFTIKRRPLCRGWLPDQIKDYDNIQQRRVKELGAPENLVVFFNVMRETISGGMLSIDRFVQQSKKLNETKGIAIVMSNIPLTSACINNPFFTYSSEPVDFKFIVKSLKPKKMLLAIPECFVPTFVEELNAEIYTYLFAIPDLRINILNQNDELMPSQFYIEELRTLCCNKITITAAHKRYASIWKSKQYNCPIYPLKPFLPDFYQLSFEKKEKIIVLSPDDHKMKDKIVKKLKEELPDYKVEIVKNMTLEEYKQLISKAMFTITFGEGWDGYFLEPYLSSSIAFAVLNTIFFPSEFDSSVPTVYDSYETMYKNIVKHIREYENKNKYEYIQTKIRIEIEKFVSNNESFEDLKSFYIRFNDPYGRKSDI